LRYVLDCTVAVKWFVPEPLSDVAEQVLIEHQRGELVLIAPDVLDAELAHAFRKLVVGNRLSRNDALTFLPQFLEMEIERVPFAPLAAEALRLALDHMATFYDALYIALAIREDVKVLTADEAMTRSFAKLDRTLFLATFRQA
jgi:predicted nucleic acid-binding protein